MSSDALSHTLAVALLASSIPLSVSAQYGKPLYGQDDRLEIVEASVGYDVLARSVAAVISVAQLAANPAGQTVAESKAIPSSKELCAEARFSRQPRIAVCTAFLVDRDLVLTSGHCVVPDGDRDQGGLPCSDAAFLFDFRVDARGDFSWRVRDSQIRHCLAVVEHEYAPRRSRDWALVKIDPVDDRAPLALASTGEAPPGSTLSVVGHPQGLPLKVALGARVIRVESQASFLTDSDTFQGNSGSPVFAEDAVLAGRPEVLGMLTAGDEDYVSDPARGCRRERLCAKGVCLGDK